MSIQFCIGNQNVSIQFCIGIQNAKSNKQPYLNIRNHDHGHGLRKCIFRLEAFLRQ